MTSLSEINARIATLNDVSTLLEIERSAFPRERWASEASLRNRLQLEDSATWLAFVDGQRAGFSNGFPIGDLSTQVDLDSPDSVLYSRKSKFWLLRNVAVHVSLQRRGIGKRLIQLQVQAARDYGSKYFRFTATENLAAYYSDQGFRMIRSAEAFHGLPQAIWELEL